MHAASVTITTDHDQIFSREILPDHDQIFSREILPHLERVCRAVARRFYADDPSGAEDVAAEAMMRAWKFRHTFISGSSAKAWLTTVTRNRAFDARKKAARDHRNAVVASTNLIDPKRFDGADGRRRCGSLSLSVEDQAIARIDARAELARISTELHPDRLAAIRLAEQGHSSIEIAEIQACAVGTVGQRVHRGRAQAREARARLCAQRSA
jgi:RNA polymerase sigma-70 factor (ECF subfamily)